MTLQPPAAARARRLLESLGVQTGLQVRSPGRVNLIGEHTDYNDGFALPMAIDRELSMAITPRHDAMVRLVSEIDGLVHEHALSTATGGPHWSGWTVYVQAMLRELWSPTASDAWGPPLGFDAAIASDLPDGAGLSSSAALEMAVARAVARMSGHPWDPTTAARAGQRGENDWVGVATGPMDQLTVAHGRRDHALLVDFASQELSPVRLPDDVEVVVLDTGARRSLVGSAYGERRSQCEAGARQLGVASLRDVTVDDLGRLEDLAAPVRDRIRHVVTENQRVLDTVAALAVGDVHTVGDLLHASHVSLRDDFEVSGPELDTMADLANGTQGVLGARMTGGGFAGAVVALARPGAVDLDDLVARYRATHPLPARALVVRPADGTSLQTAPSP